MSEHDRRVALIEEVAGTADISDFNLERTIEALPMSVREKLAEGGWPEPYCGVCRALDAPETREDIFVDAETLRIAIELVEWHDEPLKQGYRWQGGDEQYERCQRIYAAARASLAE